MKDNKEINLIFDTNILIKYLENETNPAISQKLKHFLQFGGAQYKIIFGGKIMLKELIHNKQNSSLLELLVNSANNVMSPQIDIKNDKKINSKIDEFSIKEKLNKRGKDAGIIYISYVYYVEIIFTDDGKLKNKIVSKRYSYLNQNWFPIIHNSDDILNKIKNNNTLF